MQLRKPFERYKGHVIAAAPGTHGAVFESVARYRTPEHTVLDLGAYTGALIQRLHDGRFVKTTAADLHNHLTKSDVSHIKCDFNEEFSREFHGAKFDCIVACEVIEHLDDPRAFLRECEKLLNDAGIIVVSTPNIRFFEGRIKFLLRGELWGFGAKNYMSQRHISPISIEQFPLLFKETGFEMLELSTAASFASNLRVLLTSPIWMPMRLVFGPTVLGESVIAVARKTAGITSNFKSEDLWAKDRT
jgi:SAM-dependent methyltransferase